MADRKVKQWITINGVHVPIYEGESKQAAVKRAIEKAKSNAKANEDQKAKDIAKNEKQKDELNGKSDNKPTADDIKQAYKDAWDKKGSYSKIEQLKKESGLSQRELAGIKNDANDEYDMAKSGKAVEIKGFNEAYKNAVNIERAKELANSAAKKELML